MLCWQYFSPYIDMIQHTVDIFLIFWSVLAEKIVRVNELGYMSFL